MTTLSWLTNINKSQKIVDINVQNIMDLSSFKEMMRTLMSSMMKSMAGAEADSISTKINATIADMNFEMEDKQVITFDYKNMWPLRVENKSKITAVAEGKRVEKIISKTAMFSDK